MNSRICEGMVIHKRYFEKPHQFKYKLFMMLLDLDELDYLFDDYWLWSHEKNNVASFKRKNYLKNVELVKDKNYSLIKTVKELIYKETKNIIDKVYLLTNLAYFGYCFNPISIYFCHYKNQLINCIVEVTNTPWGESHRYILEPKLTRKDVYMMSFKKALHVSPFMTMDYEYILKCKYNSKGVFIHIQNIKDGHHHFHATLSLKNSPINHKNLASVLLKFPFMTGKVILAIYWQALKLWIKGVKIVNHKEKKDD